MISVSMLHYKSKMLYSSVSLLVVLFGVIIAKTKVRKNVVLNGDICVYATLQV